MGLKPNEETQRRRKSYQPIGVRAQTRAVPPGFHILNGKGHQRHPVCGRSPEPAHSRKERGGTWLPTHEQKAGLLLTRVVCLTLEWGRVAGELTRSLSTIIGWEKEEEKQELQSEPFQSIGKTNALKTFPEMQQMEECSQGNLNNRAIVRGLELAVCALQSDGGKDNKRNEQKMGFHETSSCESRRSRFKNWLVGDPGNKENIYWDKQLNKQDELNTVKETTSEIEDCTKELMLTGREINEKHKRDLNDMEN